MQSEIRLRLHSKRDDASQGVLPLEILKIYIFFFLSFIPITFTLGHRSSHGHSWYPRWINSDIKSEFYFIPFEKQQGELSIAESIEFISLWQNQEATAASCRSKLIKEDAKTGCCSTDHRGCCCSGSFILTGRHFYIKWKQNSTQSSWWQTGSFFSPKILNKLKKTNKQKKHCFTEHIKWKSAFLFSGWTRFNKAM